MSKSKRRNKILVVDDDALNILILEEILSKEYDLVTASTGEQAIAKAEELRPDLIMLDIMMPGADGFEVCRKLRTNKNLQFTKIILVSSKSLLKDRLKGYQAGADDYISKPFDPDELMAKVRVFIRLKSVEEIERVKDDLINVFSHETRTPLNAIIGFAKLLEESDNLTPDEKEGVGFIIDSGATLLELSNKTILLSSLRKGNRAVSTSPGTLGMLVESALEKLDARIKVKNLSIKTDLEFQEVLYLDVELLETTVIYLLDNAVKFSPDNGCIEIRSGVCENNRIYLSVKDLGKGIPNERIDRLFDEFVVEDVSHHGRGHGLSLSIVNYVMELHNGDVSVKNNDNCPGTTFTLSFPQEILSNETED